MGRKQFTTEKIIGMLRESDVALAQGMKVGEICRKLGSVGAKLLSLAQGVWRVEDQSGQAHEGSGAGEQPLEEGGGGFIPG